jgi:hypothetical protein
MKGNGGKRLNRFGHPVEQMPVADLWSWQIRLFHCSPVAGSSSEQPGKVREREKSWS